MTANRTLLRMKYGRIIMRFAELSGLTVRDAMDFFYHSTERELVRDGVSDLHCMSDMYLARDLLEEYKNRTVSHSFAFGATLTHCDGTKFPTA